MNRLRLSGDSQTLNIPFDNTNIVGTGSTEKVIFNIGVDSVEVGIGDNDEVYFGLYSDDYDITNPGGNEVVVVDPDNNTITISVGGTGKIGFADGVADLGMDSGTGQPTINGNVVSSTAFDMSSITLDSLPGDVEDAGYADPDFTKIIDGGHADSTYA